MNELRLGLIGTGNITARLCEAARLCGGYRTVALLSRDAERGAAFARQNGIERVYTEEEAFFSSGLDAVYVATPNSLHAHGAQAAAAHGLHVLCEKPCAATAAEWAAMRQAATKAGVVLMEAMRPLHDPSFALIRQHLPRVGQLRHVRLEYCQYSSRYDAFLSGEIKRAFDPRYANAALMDIGVYCVAMAAALFGAPRAVHASSVFLHNGFEGGGEAVLTYDGFTVSLGYSKITASVAPSVFLGEQGVLTLDRVNETHALTLLPRIGEQEQLPYVAEPNNMIFELRDFAAMIEAGQVEHPWQQTSDVTMQILDAIRAAAGIRFPQEQ